MVTVRIGQFEATLDKGKWSSPASPRVAVKLQSVTNVDSVPTSAGNPDLVIAKKIMEAVGGTIVNVTPQYGPRAPRSMLGHLAAID